MSVPIAPVEVESLNFEEIGVRWTIRTPRGDRRRFPSLQSLRDALGEGSIASTDELSFDDERWRPLADIPDLRAFFWEVYKGVRLGRITPRTSAIIGGSSGGDDDDDVLEEDAPTTLLRPDSALQFAIQQSLARHLASCLEEKNLPPAPLAPAPAPVEDTVVPAGPTAPPARYRSLLIGAGLAAAVGSAVLLGALLLLGRSLL